MCFKKRRKEKICAQKSGGKEGGNQSPLFLAFRPLLCAAWRKEGPKVTNDSLSGVFPSKWKRSLSLPARFLHTSLLGKWGNKARKSRTTFSSFSARPKTFMHVCPGLQCSSFSSRIYLLGLLRRVGKKGQGGKPRVHNNDKLPEGILLQFFLPRNPMPYSQFEAVCK